MKSPSPANLQTSEEIREKGWQAESRDADGHLTSCHAPIKADDPGIAEWIVECTSRGETVTFWPAALSKVLSPPETREPENG
jgi:molybdopterin synthase sulfur carrier subunit